MALIAGTTGWLVCVAGPLGFGIALAAAAITLLLCLAGLFLTCAADLKDTLQLGVGAVRHALPGGRKGSTEHA